MSRHREDRQAALANTPSYSIADFSKVSLGAGNHLAQHYHHGDRVGNAAAPDDFQSSREDIVDSEMSASSAEVAAANLKDSNVLLRQELAGLTAKVAQLQRFEHELDSIREQHDFLQQSTDKRENLEQTMRTRLEERCRRLEQGNKQLKAKLEDARHKTDTTHMQTRDEMMEQLAKRDRIIHTLTAQCTSAQEESDRLRREVTQLGEQAQAIPRLESKVSANEVLLTRTQEQLSKEQLKVSRVKEFEAALHEMQEVSIKQDKFEQERRDQLENDVIILRTQAQKANITGSRDDLDMDDITSGVTSRQVCDFEELLQRREARIQQLVDDVAEWRRLYAEEMNVGATSPASRFRGNARSLADIPGESDLDHMSGLMHSELFAANRRVIELESAVKHLRYTLNDLDLEVVNTRKNANRLESHPDDRLDDESQAYSSSASPPHTPPHRTLDRGDNSSTDHQ